MTISSFLRALVPAIAAACLAAAPADAAQVKQVRVGDHPEFTRIVLELDGPASYRVEQNTVGGVAELVVGLDATTSRRIITSSSRLVEAVSLRPGASGAEARVQLRGGVVTVKEMVLKSPHRVVLDLSPVASAAAATPAPAPQAATPRPTRREVPKAETRSPSPPPEPEPRMAAAAVEETPAPDEPADSEPAAAVAPDEMAMEDAAAADEAAADEDPEAGEDEPAAMAAAEPPKSRKAEPGEPAAAAPSLLDQLGGGDPGLGLSVALGGVAFLLAAFLLLRRRSQRIAREAAAAPWPPPGAEERPEYAASAEADSGEEEPAEYGSTQSTPLFASTERDDQDAEEDVVELPEAPIDAEPEVVAKPNASPQVEELQRRIERLEARLADSLDSRERLERQLAAHTEELRVQRAAIARTQRAVRAAVRGPEGAAEQPAGQRVPSQISSPAAPEASPSQDEG